MIPVEPTQTWDQANPAECRKLLLTMLDAVYVDTIEEKAIVDIRPEPAFQPLFEIAIARQDSDVVLINEPPETDNEPGAADLCSWWRRGRVKTPPETRVGGVGGDQLVRLAETFRGPPEP